MEDVYSANGWQPIWSKAARAALEQALAARRRHGLDRVKLSVDAQSGSNAAEQEVARTQIALRYASALAQGSVDPASLHDVFTLARPDVKVTSGLVPALSDGKLSGWLEALAPQDAEYRQLSDAYLRYSQEAASRSQDKIAASGLIKVGDSDQRLPAILEQLRANDYLSADIGRGGNDTTFTQAASDAVKQLQRDYGITDDGVIGPDTVEVLNLGPGHRARALAVALERRRWLARSPEDTRIDVNVAAARLRYFRDGSMVDSRKVVVGQPGNETPALLSPIYRLVANPTWTVPRSIENGELAGVGQDYLESRNMVRRDGWIVQKSGPENALGLVKFDMQNQHAIYLHDTSSPELFGRSARHLSHGCVRVEDALGFAQQLAEDQGVGAKWQEARQSDEQTFVSLPRHVPVRLLYHNVFVDDAGVIAFRTDPYNWNSAVGEALGFAKSSGHKMKAQRADVAP